MNEDPVETVKVEAGYDQPFYVDSLFGLNHGLSQTFLAPADCDSLDANDQCVGDGELDVTVDEIVRRFDHATNDAVSAEERWDLPDVFDVGKVQNESLDLALMQIAVTETVKILENTFTSVWSEQQPITPTLLFATQHQFRALNLDEGNPNDQAGDDGAIAWNGANLTLSLPQSGESANPVILSSLVKWAPYVYDPAIGWAAADIIKFWDEMNAQLGGSFGDISDSDEAKTYQTMAQMLYLAAYQGISQTAMVDDKILTNPLQNDDSNLANTLTAVSDGYFSGLTQVYYDYTPELEEVAQDLNPDLYNIDPVESAIVVQSGIAISTDVLVALQNSRGPMVQMNPRGELILDEDGEVLWIANENSSKTGAVWSAVVFVAIILIYTAIMILESADLGGTIGEIVSVAAFVVQIMLLVMTTISFIFTMLKIVFVLIAASTFTSAWSALSANVTVASTAVAVIGLVITILVALGFFFYLWASNKIQPGTIAFNYTLGYTVATIIIAVAIFLVVLFTGPIGAIVVLLVGLIDVWASILGAKWSISAMFTEWLAGLIYQYKLQEKMDVETGTVQLDIVYPEDGMIAGNTLKVTLPITTALTAKAGGKEELNSNSFVYSLTEGEKKLSTSRGGRKSDWILSGDDATLVDLPSVTTTLAASVNFRPSSLTLNSAYALRGQSCWFGVCETKFVKGSSSENVGYSIVLDVLPATLDEFVAVETWGKPGVHFYDRDGDGLLPFSMGGADPDETTWDADGDDLSDFYELNARNRAGIGGAVDLNPLLADTDGDTLLDGEELRLGSNPGNIDSDGDGLLDVEELPPFGGWLLPYAVDKSTRIWSDPFSADADGDGLSDLFERTQLTCPECDPWADPSDPEVYNPRVWNPNPVPLYVDDNTIGGFVQPGATIVYTTTTANNLAGQELAGRLSVALNGGFSGAPLAADVAISSGESQSLVTVLQAGNQPGAYTIESQMELTDFDVTAWTMQNTTSNTTSAVNGGNVLAVAAVTPTGWPAPHLLVTREQASAGVESISAYIARADSQVLDAAVLDNSSANSSLTGPSLACEEDGHCLAVWGVNDNNGNIRIAAAQMLNGVITATQFDVWSGAGSTVSAPAVASNGSDYLVTWLAGNGSNNQVWVQAVPGESAISASPNSPAGPTSGITSVTTAWNGLSYDVIYVENNQLQRVQVNEQGQMVTSPTTLALGASGWPMSDGSEQAPALVFDPRSQQSLLLYRNDAANVALVGLLLSSTSIIDSVTLDSADALSGNDTAAAACADPVNAGWVTSWTQPGDANVLFQALSPDGTLRGQRSSRSSQSANPALAISCSEPRPVLALEFEEPAGSTYFADSSGAGYDFYCKDEFCPLAGVDGRFGNGVNFDGLNDQLSQDFPQSGAEFSTALWMRTTAQSAEILLRQSEFERIYLNNGNLCAWVQEQSGKDTICTSGSNYSDGVWHHVTHTSYGATHQLYVNGELEVTGGQLGSLNICANCEDFTLGVTAYGPAYQGQMDVVNYYDRTLTGAEVKDIFEGALAVYELNEVPGSTTFVDSANNGFAATCSGNGCPTLGVEGVAYTAAEFDGVQDELKVAPVPQVDAIYAYDFDGATTAGIPDEWSPKNTQTNYFRNGKPEEFFGFMQNQKATLDLSNLPPHDTVEISFDLYLIGEWNGNRTRGSSDNTGTIVVGPDIWSFGYGSTQLLRSTFALSPNAGTYQSYPNAAPSGATGIKLYGDKDCTSRETLLKQDTPDLAQSAVGDGTVGNNNASCIKFPGGKDTVAVLFQHKDYDGKAWVQDPKGNVAESGWNNEPGSVGIWPSGYAPGYGDTGDTLSVGTTQLRSSIYHITKSFSHTENALQFYFDGESSSEAPFGLDNVVVKVKSEKSSIPLTDSSFTLSAWAKRTKNDVDGSLLFQGVTQNNQGLQFRFMSNNGVKCGFWGNDLSTSATYTDSEWHHWACTYDDATRKRTIYRDGVQVAQDTAATGYSGFGATYIGRRSDGKWPFQGVLDEVAIWPTPLSAEQIGELFAKVKAQDETVMVGLSPSVDEQPQLDLSGFTLRETTTELGVTSQTLSRELTIDADAPSTMIASPSAGAYVRGDGTLGVSGTASDPTSSIGHVMVKVGDGPWQRASGTEAWTVNVDGSAVNEGDVTASAQATDLVGNTGTVATQSFILDRTPPAVTLNQSGILRPTRNESGVWQVSLSGAVVDPAAGAQPGSGVAGLEAVLLAEAPLSGNGWQNATVANDNSWSLGYLLPPLGVANPSGLYTLTLRASDAVSNTTDATSNILLLNLDVAGPEITIETPPTTTEVISTALTLTGQALDANKVVEVEINFTPAEQVAALNGSILHLPFDERSATKYFLDQSGANNAADCGGGQCPVMEQPGQRDLSGMFQAGRQLVTKGLDLTDQSFTLSAWAKRQGNGINGTILSQGTSGNNQGLVFGFRDSDVFTCSFGGDDLDTAETYTDSEWHHWSCAYDATTRTRTLYRDGVQVAQDVASANFGGSGLMHVGARFDVSDHFTGLLDEVMVHEVALVAYEVANLLAYGQEANWEVVSTSGDVNPTWSYTVPEGVDGLEGMFQVNVRGRDELGNVTPISGQRVWRGEIDTRPPEITYTATIDESGVTPTVRYDCVATDYNLDQSQLCLLVAPATVPEYRLGDLTSTTYDQVDPWYLATFEDPARLYQVVATRTYSGTIDGDLQLQACDLNGRCTTAAAEDIQAQAQSQGSEVLAPSSGAALTGDDNQATAAAAGQVGQPITIYGDAYSETGLHTVLVTINGQVRHTEVWEEGSPPTEAHWEFDWAPEREDVYVIQPLVVGRLYRTHLPLIHQENSNATEVSAAATAAATAADEIRSVDEMAVALGGVAGEPVVIYVDNTPPTVTITTTRIIEIQSVDDLLVPIFGHANDNVSISHVDVSINGGPWRHARVGPLGNWGLIWHPGGHVDNKTVNINVRVTDMAGFSATAESTLQVDTSPPTIGQIEVFYETGSGDVLPAEPGQPLADAKALIFRWGAATDASGISVYRAGLTGNVVADLDELPAYSGPGEQRLDLTGPGKWYAHIIVVDGAGNTARAVEGPFVIE
ncbi:MAG: hypothetical protein GY764_15890 [Halieaceae bacterium]|nr:hypothetical protein [Halieaceae bacterium]